MIKFNPEHGLDLLISEQFKYYELLQILVVGYFHEAHPPLAKSNLFCVCGDECVPAELVQSGVYRCFVSAHKPGLVDLYLSFDLMARSLSAKLLPLSITV